MAKNKKAEGSDELTPEEMLGQEETTSLLKEIQNRGFFVARKPATVLGGNIAVDMSRWKAGQKFRFGVVSDTHLGSRYQQLTALNQFYTIIKRRRIETVLHAGDITDGEKMYRGHEYEIFAHGADMQRNYAVANYPSRTGVKTLLISGNHDQSFIKTAGYNIAKAIAAERPDIDFIGDDLAFVNFDNIKVALMHGRGGVAYARSYKSQKIVEQVASENKPHFLFLGHYHVPNHIPGYRNVETVQMSCFQGQTPYLVAKGLYPFVAGLIVEVKPDSAGLASVKYEWIPFYKIKKDDF